MFSSGYFQTFIYFLYVMFLFAGAVRCYEDRLYFRYSFEPERKQFFRGQIRQGIAWISIATVIVVVYGVRSNT